MERINQEVEVFLQYYQQDYYWMELLLAAAFQYNGKKYSATGYIPFKLNFG